MLGRAHPGVARQRLVAACALLAKAPLATANRADFQPFVPHGMRLD